MGKKINFLNLYLIAMPFNTFANRADPGQSLLCLLMEIWLDMILH